jgi:hypothetical protein
MELQMKRFREFWAKLGEFSDETGAMLGLTILVVVGSIIRPFAPIVTIIFVVMGTMYAITRKQGVWAIGGLVLYAASFPAVESLGQLPAAVIWGLGMGLWFSGLILSMEHSFFRRSISKTS